MSIFIVLALAGTNAALAAPTNPLAPAADGQLQCHQPNDEKRTCRSIASYQRKDDGTYTNTAVVLLSSAGPVTLETTTVVTLKAGAVCGAIRANDLNTGKLRVAGRLLPDSEAAPILPRIAQSMASVIDKEICTSYEESTQGLTAKATISGEYRPDADQRVKWVQANDGYQVAP